MDLKDIKKQADNGVIISKVQWLKVLEAAIMMEERLQEMALVDGSPDNVLDTEVLASRVRTSANSCLSLVGLL